MSKWSDPNKKVQTMVFDKIVLNKLKAYAVETDQSFDTVIQGPFTRFEAELLELCREIDRIRQDAVKANTPQAEPILE